jgi:hypothetical protein
VLHAEAGRADYQAWRARGISADGRRFGGREPNLEPLPEQPRGNSNTTDLDSRNVKTPRSYTQGYNAQAVVNEHQIVLAAEVTVSSPDFGHLEPMVEATNKELEAIGRCSRGGAAEWVAGDLAELAVSGPELSPTKEPP